MPLRYEYVRQSFEANECCDSHSPFISWVGLQAGMCLCAAELVFKQIFSTIKTANCHVHAQHIQKNNVKEKQHNKPAVAMKDKSISRRRTEENIGEENTRSADSTHNRHRRGLKSHHLETAGRVQKKGILSLSMIQHDDTVTAKSPGRASLGSDLVGRRLYYWQRVR